MRDLPACLKCGLIHERDGRPTCAAHRRDGGPCRRWPKKGLTVCRQCGGAAPQVQAAAARRQARAELEQEVRALGVPDDIDPVRGLLREIAQTAGELEWLRQLIVVEAGADAEALFRGTRYLRRKDGPLGQETVTEVGPALSVKMQTYERWKRIFAQLVQVALAHNIAQAQIDIAERDAEMHGALVAAALDAAGVTGDQRVAAIGAARSRFLARYGGAA